MKIYYLLLALLITIFSYSQEKNHSNVDQLVNCITGKFDSNRQAQNYDQFTNIQLVIVPVWEDKDEHWLYVEEAAGSNTQEPFKQVLYNISKSKDEGIISEVYELKNPEKFTGKWKNPSFFDQITTDNITPINDCVMYITQEAMGLFKVSTKDKACSSVQNGDKYATSILEISPEALTSRVMSDNGGNEARIYTFIKKESFK